MVAVALGALARGRDWLWAFLIVPAQVTTMMVRSGELSGLWPLAMILASMLSTPFLAAAFVGSRLRRVFPISNAERRTQNVERRT